MRLFTEGSHVILEGQLVQGVFKVLVRALTNKSVPTYVNLSLYMNVRTYVSILVYLNLHVNILMSAYPFPLVLSTSNFILPTCL